MVEGARLEIAYTALIVSRVRIPPAPPAFLCSPEVAFARAERFTPKQRVTSSRRECSIFIGLLFSCGGRDRRPPAQLRERPVQMAQVLG